MPLATEYMKQQLEHLTREELLDQIVQLTAENLSLKRRVGGQAADSWYRTGQPVRYTPADGQW